MGDTVFVNRRSAIHAGSAGQSTAFPDVNLCPPAPPAGPIPTPLPNIARGADLQGGASSVLIEGNPMAKKSSLIATSTGNEVAQSTGGGVVSHVVKGQAYFVSYSIDVTVEGEEVPRHLDMLTHNHAGPSPPNSAVGTYIGVMGPAEPGTILPAHEAPPPERTKSKPWTYRMFLASAPSRMDDHGDAYELCSHDGKYRRVVAASAAERAGDSAVIKFKDLLPGKLYSLTRLVGGDESHRVPLFEGVGYAALLQEPPGPPPPPRKHRRKATPAKIPQPAPPADPLLDAEVITTGDDWYWSHHIKDREDDGDQGGG